MGKEEKAKWRLLPVLLLWTKELDFSGVLKHTEHSQNDLLEDWSLNS
jgi:hypothetical protein